MSAALERDVGGPAGEAQLLVQRDGALVLLVDVEHRLVEPAATQVPQAGEGQRPAQAEALRGGIDAEDVDLADRLVGVARGALHPPPVEPDPLPGTLRPPEALPGRTAARPPAPPVV